jgi:hypothetical protein
MKAVQRVVFAAALVIGWTAIAPVSVASAESMTFTVQSNYKYKVQVAFYSQTRKHEWPGNGEAYNLNDSEAHEYPLSCNEGEKVCFGGWVTGNGKKYWGVGFNGVHSCKACCFICGAGDIPTQVLNDSDDE